MDSPHESDSKQAKTLKLKKPNSSSSSSSDEDSFQLDASELIKSVPNASNHGDAQLASEVDVGRGETTSIKAGGVGVTQSPPNQVIVMEADPHRIPSSVFARSKSTTPMEWSLASNESLFSINVGNSSFSRDNIFLGRSGELSNLPSSSAQFTPSPTVGNSDAKSWELKEGIENPGPTEVANAKTMKEVLRVTANEHCKAVAQPGDLGHNASSASRHSDAIQMEAQPVPDPLRFQCRLDLFYLPIFMSHLHISLIIPLSYAVACNGPKLG